MCVVKGVAFGVFGAAVAAIAHAKASPAGNHHVSKILSMRYPTALTSSADEAH